MKDISAVRSICLWNTALAKNLGWDLAGCRWISRSQNFFTIVLLNTTLLNLKIPEVSRFGLCICNIKIAYGSRNRNCLGSRIQPGLPSLSLASRSLVFSSTPSDSWLWARQSQHSCRGNVEINSWVHWTPNLYLWLCELVFWRQAGCLCSLLNMF